ncbi:MAG: zinc ABC transporter substrate-binding protein [bacterium]|nr:zinc ABC transporter substrate-binding protein [bacterium]
MIRMLFALVAFALFSTGAVRGSAQDSAPTVIATTTILADIAAQVSGGLVDVQSLLPPDADTHAYQPGVEDAARITEADLLLTVGMGYEAFLGGLLEAAGADVPVIVVSNGIEILAFGGHDQDDQAEAEPGAFEVIGVLGDGLECEAEQEEGEATADAALDEAHEHGACDPHVWMNPLNMIAWAENIAEAFAQIDSANADTYRANAAAYAAQLEALDLDLAQQIAEIPEDRRVLVTNHEFMAYFAHHYGFEIAATVIPGGSTDAEVDPQALAELITLVQEEGVPAIFSEASANAAVAELVAQEAGVAIVTTLFSEALSAPGGGAPTYLDFMRANVGTIVNALR